MSSPKDWRNPPPVDFTALKNFVFGVFGTAGVFMFLAVSMYCLYQVALIYRELLPW